MMASLDNKDDALLTTKDKPADTGHGAEMDVLGGHLFRAEIELHYALMEARTQCDFEKAALIELALATVQSCGAGCERTLFRP